MTNKDPTYQVQEESGARARKHWSSPRLLRLDAGSAEAGSNPDRPEGPFAFGGS